MIEAAKIASTQHYEKFPRARYPLLNQELEQALDCIKLFATLDPHVPAKQVLDRKKILKTPIYQDAAGFEDDLDNRTSGRMAVLFPHKKQHFAFYVDWKEIYSLMDMERLNHRDSKVPFARPGKASYAQPDIAYLEYLITIIAMTVIALFKVVSSKTRALFKNKSILFLTDNQVSLAWDIKARCPFFPWWRLTMLQLIAESVLGSRFHFAWVSTHFQKADGLTRGDTKYAIGKRKSQARKLPLAIKEFIAKILDGSITFRQLFFRYNIPKLLSERGRKVFFSPTFPPSFFTRDVIAGREVTTQSLYASQATSKVGHQSQHRRLSKGISTFWQRTRYLKKVRKEEESTQRAIQRDNTPRDFRQVNHHDMAPHNQGNEEEDIQC